ncbi:MAG: hypothetical protein AB7O59_01160 [Pirellulales bacterium]
MQSPALFNSLALALLLSVPATAAEAAPRYQQMLAQCQALSPAQQADWLNWQFNRRLEPACRATLDRAAYDDLLAQQATLLARVRAGRALTTAEIKGTLAAIDRHEQAAIGQLISTYSEVAHEAVGTNLWAYQQRMKYCAAVKRLSEAAARPFEAQNKLIGWLEAAVLQQRLSAYLPMPPVPDFAAIDDNSWQQIAASTQEVRTAYAFDDRQPTAAELASQIERYNSDLEQVVDGLYDRRVFSVDELNRIVDRIAKLGLVRVGLAAGTLALPQADQDEVQEIEPLDTAIKLARVKISAARRQVLRQANHDTSRRQWDELAGYNRISQRLDMLATGPDR